MLELFKKYQNIIKDYQIDLWENEPTTYRFKAKIVFKDHSFLIVRDYLFPSGRKYAYHWQRENGELIIRWDNAGHWQNIITYPHHKHVDSPENVVESTAVWIEDILEIIHHKIGKHNE